MKQCGAKARTNGHKSCRKKAMANGRCRFHGGMSTGPRTEKGKERARAAVLKHGFYTPAAVQERRVFRENFREFQEQLNSLNYSVG